MNERRCETKQEGQQKKEEKGNRRKKQRERKQEYERISRTISFDEAAAGITTRIYLETLEVRPLFTVETIIVTFAMPVRARHSLDDGKLHRRRGIIKKKWRPFNALGRREERKGGKKSRSLVGHEKIVAKLPFSL